MKIAICLTGSMRTKNCLNEIDEYLIKSNPEHDIRIIKCLWDITGDRYDLDHTMNEYDIKTDRVENNRPCITRISTEKANIDDGYDYMKIATELEKNLPNIKWTNFHCKNYYFNHISKLYLLEQALSKLDESYDLIFVTRTDTLMFIEKPIHFIDKFVYEHGGKLVDRRILDYDKYVEIKDLCSAFDWNLPSSDMILTTFIRNSGTFGFEWFFGDYKTMKKFSEIYSSFNYISRLVTLTHYSIADEVSKEIHCMVSNIKIHGFEPDGYEYDLNNIVNINHTQTQNIYHAINRMHIPEALF
jgi:hypothetical protein